ncbi:MAG: tRNA (adenosine(37)-N6)-threonylcarbamoyltransferase complex ATPase subunit type 1 TsaE [Bacillales bacterium]|nr:tRNA (adenosine(37)-N6)-threonylcarbamoyltransferase complex ATPase subunit type 1 TsaE [Bacillales bacterium]
MIKKIKNLEELRAFAEELSLKIKKGTLIGLKGPLGAGKTTLVKYIGKALKVKEEIISPTFNIIKVYDSILGPLYHIDAYRLENIDFDPTVDEYLYDEKAVRIVEWYEYLSDPIFNDAIKIEIKVEDNDDRTLFIEGMENV